MRILVFLCGVLALIVAGCCIAGCTFLPFSQDRSSDNAHSGTPAGFATGAPPDAPTEFTSEMDIAGLYSIDYSGTLISDDMADENNNTPTVNGTMVGMPGNIHIYYIKGESLTESGKASRWTYAVQYMNRTFLITRDRYGLSVIPWNATLPEDEISVERIISPAELISRNHASILAQSDPDMERDISLSLINDTYSVRIIGREAVNILTFDAKTGALI